MNHAIEHSVLRVHEAWDLLDAEVNHLKLGNLDRNDPAFVSLKRMRDKLVAHRVENEVYAEEHQRWYKEELGSFQKSFEVVTAVARALAVRIRELQRSGDITAPNLPLRDVPEFSGEDVAQLVQALKRAEIF